MAEKIRDFGEFIGGAQKDLWRQKGLSEDDLLYMNEEEMKKYVQRDSVWPLPDAKKQVEGGLPPFIAYWQRQVRLCLYKVPRVMEGEDIMEARKNYIRVATEIKNAAMAIKEESEMPEFYKKAADYFGFDKDIFRRCASPVHLLKFSHRRLKMKVESTGFPYTVRKQVIRKKSFIPPQLTKIEREGPDYRKGKNINADIWQRDFFFRGVQFGNWMSQKDRQFSMNYCYDALRDLAVILGMEDKDVAFGGKLALAFGARGMSNSSAHFEPERAVINLTKMHGAGCTAHEWYHALDYFMAKFYGVTDAQFASKSKETDKLPPVVVSLTNSIKVDAEGNTTDYFKGSASFDKSFKKDTFGGWSTTIEMLARAFACYVKDVWDKKSDYLIAHADAYVFEFDNQSISAIPQGEERDLFNEMFDQLFYRLKQDGFLHERQAATVKEDNTFVPAENVAYPEMEYDVSGQYVMNFC